MAAKATTTSHKNSPKPAAPGHRLQLLNPATPRLRDSAATQPQPSIAASLPLDAAAVVSTSKAVSTCSDLAAFKGLSRFLKSNRYTYLQVLQHFFLSDHRLNEAPALLDEAIFVILDLEWWEKMELDENVTEVGITVLQAKNIRKYAEHLGIETMLTHAKTHHWRVEEYCHMRNRLPKLNPGAELNSLFAHTRFLKKTEIKRELIKIFHGHSEEGPKAPVILVGHAIWHDTRRIKRQYGLDVEKIPNVIFQIKGMNEIAMSLGIQDEKIGSLAKILQSFQVDERWHHNAANDSMYTLLPMLLFGMYPSLYPKDTADYPKDSKPAGTEKSLNAIICSVSAARLSQDRSKLGYHMFCFYCNAKEDHMAEHCPKRSIQEPCQLCSQADGYHSQANKHRTNRCVFKSNHGKLETCLPVKENENENLEIDETGYETDYPFIETEWEKAKARKKQEKEAVLLASGS